MSEPLAILPSVVFDANVLLQAPIRDTLLRCAEANLLLPIWSDEILEEVRRNFVRVARPRQNPEEKISSLLRALDLTFPDARIDGYHDLIPQLTNDLADRHVLAVAIHARATHIVTYNTRHFPARSLQGHGVVAVPPDTLLVGFFRRNPSLLWRILARQGAELHHPRTTDEVLRSLQSYAPHFVALARQALGDKSH